EHGTLPVPFHLRNAPTALMQKLGYGKNYKYAHNYPDHVVEQEHLPKELKDKKYYTPSDSGYESRIKERLKRWEEKKKNPNNRECLESNPPRIKSSRVLDSRQIQQKGIGKCRLMVSFEAAGSTAVSRVHVGLQ